MKNYKTTIYESFDGKRFLSEAACMRYEAAFQLRKSSACPITTDDATFMSQMLQMARQFKEGKGPAAKMLQIHREQDHKLCSNCLLDAQGPLELLATKFGFHLWGDCDCDAAALLNLYRKGYLNIDLGDIYKVDLTKEQLQEAEQQYGHSLVINRKVDELEAWPADDESDDVELTSA